MSNMLSAAGTDLANGLTQARTNTGTLAALLTEDRLSTVMDPALDAGRIENEDAERVLRQDNQLQTMLANNPNADIIIARIAEIVYIIQ